MHYSLWFETPYHRRIDYYCSHEKQSTFVGYKKIVVSSKPTASSFSFGQKHKHITRNDTDGPGPANYDITGLSVRGIKTNRRYNIDARSRVVHQRFQCSSKVFPNLTNWDVSACYSRPFPSNEYISRKSSVAWINVRKSPITTKAISNARARWIRYR